jgi:hypothetical protein
MDLPACFVVPIAGLWGGAMIEDLHENGPSACAGLGNVRGVLCAEFGG